MLDDAIARVEIEVTNRRIATGPSPSTPVGPGHITPTPTGPLPPVYEDNTQRKRRRSSLTRLQRS
jgi:hypothetical protein